MNQKLKKQIQKKLDKLTNLLDAIDEARIINADDSDTWDSDVLYNLAKNLKEALKLLEDKKNLQEKDSWGEPLIREEGLCSLMSTYQNEDEEEGDDD